MNKKITTEVELLPFMTPNFVLAKDSYAVISIKDLSEEEIRGLCAEFTHNLMKKAGHIK